VVDITLFESDATLSSGFSATDTVRCVTANDGTSDGNTEYAEIVISSTGPEH
ncbi:uncharacterized protein METZ01_LOCUS221372, partial [marine metagenome]